MATEVFRLKGTNYFQLVSTTSAEFGSSNQGYKNYSDSVVLYEVPQGKRAKIIIRSPASFAPASSIFRVYHQSQKGSASTELGVSGSSTIIIGEVTLLNIISSLTSQASTNMIYYQGLMHYPYDSNYFIKTDSTMYVSDFFLDPTVLPKYFRLELSHTYLNEGEQIKHEASHNFSSSQSDSYSFSSRAHASYDFDIIEEDAV